MATKAKIKGGNGAGGGSFSTPTRLSSIEGHLKHVVTKDYLNDQLKPFITKEYLNDQLKHFATKTDLEKMKNWFILTALAGSATIAFLFITAYQLFFDK